MSRINNNVSSLIAQRILGQQNHGMSKSLERLSTGLRINRGADDPAGLIASENLRSEKVMLSAALGNAERADQVVNVAEGGLQEINSLLLEVQGLVSQSASDAGLSTEEKEANQQQIDAIIQTIDRIASSTSFQGTKLLNGSFDFTVSDQAGTVSDFKINGAKLGDEDLAVKAIITQSAQNAGVMLSLGGTSLDLSSTDARLTFEIAGADGSREFTFSSGTTTADMAAQINTFTDATGISATVSGNGVVLKSTEFGSSQFVSIDIVDDGGQTGGVALLNSNNNNEAIAPGFTGLAGATTAIRDEGQDVGAIVNGVTARGKGQSLAINTDALAVEMTLTDAGAQALGSISAFTITGGGAKFNLGPTVDINNQVRLGIGNVAARKLGSAAEGYLTQLGSGSDANVVDGDVGKAQRIVNDAIKATSTLRGRLGSFQQNVVRSTINTLGVALENTSAAESAIRDTDFAAETAELTRSQILVQAASSVLGIANSQPQSVLSLL